MVEDPGCETKDGTGPTFEMTSAVSAKVEHRCNPVLARKSSINLVPMLYPLPRTSASASPALAKRTLQLIAAHILSSCLLTSA